MPVTGTDIQDQGGVYILQARLVQPGLTQILVAWMVTWLPREVWQVAREMNRVLPGARSDLQDDTGAIEHHREFFENNLFVVLAGLRKGFSFHRKCP